MKKILCIILGVIMCTSIMSACNKEENTIKREADERNLTAAEYTRLNTVGVDSLGRVINEKSEKEDGTRYVGIFYSFWLGQHKNSQSDIYDITKILQSEEGELRLRDTSKDYADTKVNQFHFFTEPLYGYYSMDDEWVITRHIELLTLCGIDYLCVDATNTVIYANVGHKVLTTLLKFQQQGFDVPKLLFYTNSSSGTTVSRIYNEYYLNHPEYESVWFKPNGKPTIVGITENNNNASGEFSAHDYISKDMQEYFDVFESQWPTTKITGADENPNALPWMSWYYPQSVHANTKAINVSVAQHSDRTISYSDKDRTSSKGYDHDECVKNSAYWEGNNFESQWKSVFDYLSYGTEIRNVLVTGWNEFMAIKTPYNGGVSYCDGWDDEYSRDIEMTNGPCGDNFYLQLMRNLREYKYKERVHYKYQTITIDTTKVDENWEFVKAHYLDFNGDAMARDCENAIGKNRYTDNSNRNDITDIKVVHDSEYIYFYVKTKDNITAYNGTDKNWMTILIDSNSNGTGFEGYNYIINRSPSNGKTSIEKSQSGYNWESVGTGDYAVYGNVMIYKLPLSALGLSRNNCYIKFKVTDNISNPDNILDYYKSGDSAPIGRLSYSYGY